jgi:hypothetical protein
MVSIDEQIACALREVRMREGAYKRWVASGKMTQAKAHAEITTMRTIVETLKLVQSKDWAALGALGGLL